MTCILCLGCQSNSFKDVATLTEFLQNPQNGYIQHKSINGYDFSLMYKPTDLVVGQQTSAVGLDESANELREKYEDFLYFTLSIGKGGKEVLSAVPSGRKQFGEMVQQLVFDMDKKVHLTTRSRDTLPLIDYTYPRMYGMSSATSMLFVFPRKKESLTQEYLEFSIEDIGLLTGEVSFKIPLKHIVNEPTLIN